MMHTLISRRTLLRFLVGSGGVLLTVPTFARDYNKPQTKPSAAISKPNSKLPSWDEIEKTVQKALAETTGYQAGDLINQADGTRVFAALKKCGWDLKTSGELTKQLLPANDDLVRELNSKRGKVFMREVAKTPGGFDRLDRLRKLPNGRRRLQELIIQPGGFTLIQYMATTPGGKTMGRELSSKKRGNFNAPTKRIYTASGLIQALKPIYAAQTATPK